MGELLSAAAGLGIAGVDPFGALIAIGAMTSGASRKTVVIYGLITLIGTALLGIALSLFVGAQLENIGGILDQDDEVWLAVESALGAVLIVWGFSRFFNPRPDNPRGQEAKGTSLAALIATTPFLFLSSLVDPTFLGITVIASQDASLLGVILAHVVWNLFAQSPLVALLVASFFHLDDELADWFQRWTDRLGPALAKVGTALLFIIGGFLLFDVFWWFYTGSFLVEW